MRTRQHHTFRTTPTRYRLTILLLALAATAVACAGLLLSSWVGLRF